MSQVNPEDLEAAFGTANVDLRRPSRREKPGRRGARNAETEANLEEETTAEAGRRPSASRDQRMPSEEVRQPATSRIGSPGNRKDSTEPMAVPDMGKDSRATEDRRSAIDAGPSFARTSEYVDFGQKVGDSAAGQPLAKDKLDGHAIDMPEEDKDGSMMVPMAVGPRIRDRDGLTKEERTLKNIEEAKQIVGEALQKAVARGERMEQVEADAEALKMQTAVFHTDTKKAAERIKWLEHRSKIICGCVALGIILVLFLLAVIASKLR